jgi:hypothetical protein
MRFDLLIKAQVITSDGQFRIANPVIHNDLYWALRGGGGGTFAIVIQVTVKAYPSPRVTVSSFWLNTTNSTSGAIYPAAAYLHSQFPALNAQGVQGYYFIYKNAMQGVFMLPSKSATTARRLWQPTLKRLQAFAGMMPVIQDHQTFSNFKEFFDVTFGMINQTDYDIDEKCKRKMEWKPTLYECKYNTTGQWGYSKKRRGPKATILPRQRYPAIDVLDPVC